MLLTNIWAKQNKKEKVHSYPVLLNAVYQIRIYVQHTQSPLHAHIHTQSIIMHAHIVIYLADTVPIH